MRWMFLGEGEAGRGNKGDMRGRDKNWKERDRQGEATQKRVSTSGGKQKREGFGRQGKTDGGERAGESN